MGGLVLAAALTACGPTSSVESESIDAGVKSGAPDASVGSTKYTCTSDVMWDLGDEGNERMHPGMACIACHKSHEEQQHGDVLGDHDVPKFVVAGTLYPKLHELNDCNGVPNAVSGAVIEITDSAGKQLSLLPNVAGNFFSDEALQFPIRAKVTANGKVREMVAPQVSGDCNSCHTPGGLSGAPGRVYLPE